MFGQGSGQGSAFPFRCIIAVFAPLAVAVIGEDDAPPAPGALPELAARKVKARPLSPDDIDKSLVPPMWNRGLRQPAAAARGSRPGHLRGVRAEAAAQGPAGPGRVRGTLAPL